MGFPAARIKDTYLCPMVTGLIPHLSGMLEIGGATNVFIEKKPAAMQGTLGICQGTGEPCIVTMGSTTVFINGKPAARQLDLMAHGGPIALGATTVSIG